MAKKSKKKPSPKKATSGKPAMTRRRWLGLIAVVPAAAVAGTMIHRHDVRKKTDHDLSVVGQGEPVVVQIHDPSCGLCRRLMANSRQALKKVPELTYRIADVTDFDGADFQTQYNVPNVTLLLFDGKGKLRQTIQGVTSTDDLTIAFRALVAKG